jgi:hypothetical protein
MGTFAWVRWIAPWLLTVAIVSILGASVFWTLLNTPAPLSYVPVTLNGLVLGLIAVAALQKT